MNERPRRVNVRGTFKRENRKAGGTLNERTTSLIDSL